MCRTSKISTWHISTEQYVSIKQVSRNKVRLTKNKYGIIHHSSYCSFWQWIQPTRTLPFPSKQQTWLLIRLAEWKRNRAANWTALQNPSGQGLERTCPQNSTTLQKSPPQMAHFTRFVVHFWCFYFRWRSSLHVLFVTVAELQPLFWALKDFCRVLLLFITIRIAFPVPSFHVPLFQWCSRRITRIIFCRNLCRNRSRGAWRFHTF